MSTLAERLESVRRTRFVGRSAECSLFQSALTAPELPFYVIHIFGPGGVGKTTLLHEFTRLAKEAGVPVIYLDGRHIDPSPDFFLLALQQVLGIDPAVSPFPALAGERHYQGVSPVQSRIFLNMVQHYLTAPGLAFTFLPCAAPEFWADVFAYADLTLLPDAGFVVDGRFYAVFGHDWRVTPPMAWLGLMADREIEDQPPPERPAAPALVVLSESDFAAAVRQALRDFTDAAALTGNPLIRSHLVARQAPANADEKTCAAVLQELLRETAGALQNTPRQAKFYRALHHTCFQPAPTQEKAAELLGLPFSTYRRHLRSGIQYITERLWQLELSAAA